MKKALEILALSTALLFPLSGGLKANAQDIKPKQVIELEEESNIQKPKIEINFNYKKGSSPKQIDSSLSHNIYVPTIEYFYRSENIPELNSDEKDKIESIVVDIQHSNITSYQKLIEISQNLSDSQKLVLSSTIGNLLYRFNYDFSLQDLEVASQDDFFSNLQNSLESGEHNTLGVCRHIATHIEKFLNDVGVKSAAVSGISENGVGHVYNIAKIENKTAIIDSYKILIADTKNIEKTLKAYQKHNGTIAFQHSFFEDALFKYRLITEDGKKFLDFVEYDESSEPLKKALVRNIETEPHLAISMNIEDYLTSFKANVMGLFAKFGKIKRDDSSPLEKTNLFQFGFKRNFIISDIMKINPEVSFFQGFIPQDTELNKNDFYGVDANLVIASNNEKGFNCSLRAAGTISKTENYAPFYDSALGGGISYKISTEKINIEPYTIAQFTFIPKDLGTYEFAPKLSELVLGANLDIKMPNDSNLSFNPYYTKRIWEQEFGGDISLNVKDVKMSVGGNFTKSNYEFCPDKFEVDVGLGLNLKKFKVNAKYNLDATNYDGEKENHSSFGVEASVQF